MKNHSAHFVLFLALAASALLAPVAKATVILFDVTGTNPSGQSLVSSATGYGDNVAAASQGGSTYGIGNGFTPNVVSAFSLGSSGAADQEFYDDGVWTGVDFLQETSSGAAYPRDFFITFTPDSGYGVRVNSFDLGQYFRTGEGRGNITIDWYLRQSTTSGTIIASQTSQSLASTISGSGGMIGFSSGVSGFYAGPVVLQIAWTANSPTGNNSLAIDNINFDQVVIPEPGTVALVTMGLGLLLFRSRKLFGKRVG